MPTALANVWSLPGATSANTRRAPTSANPPHRMTLGLLSVVVVKGVAAWYFAITVKLIGSIRESGYPLNNIAFNPAGE